MEAGATTPTTTSLIDVGPHREIGVGRARRKCSRLTATEAAWRFGLVFSARCRRHDLTRAPTSRTAFDSRRSLGFIGYL